MHACVSTVDTTFAELAAAYFDSAMEELEDPALAEQVAFELLCAAVTRRPVPERTLQAAA